MPREQALERPRLYAGDPLRRLGSPQPKKHLS